MRVTVEVGRKIIPRGHTVPIEMVFIETDEDGKNVAHTMKALLSAYLILSKQFLAVHAIDCTNCPAFKFNTEIYKCIQSLGGAEVGIVNVL